MIALHLGHFTRKDFCLFGYKFTTGITFPFCFGSVHMAIPLPEGGWNVTGGMPKDKRTEIDSSQAVSKIKPASIFKRLCSFLARSMLMRRLPLRISDIRLSGMSSRAASCFCERCN